MIATPHQTTDAHTRQETVGEPASAVGEPVATLGAQWKWKRLDRFERIARIASRLFNVGMAWVEDETEEQIHRFGQVDPLNTATGAMRNAPQGGLRRELQVVYEETQADSLMRDRPDRHGYHYIARVALADDTGERLGTLVLADIRPRHFDANEIETLDAFAKTISAELSMQKQSSTDPLTGLQNRLGFWRAAEAITELLPKGGVKTSLLLFDLDGFKQINDHFGHAEGDLALQQFAGLLRRAFRATDLVARLGGDEFAVLANSTGRHAVAPAIERLQQAVDGCNAGADRGYKLAFSVGIVTCPTHGHGELGDLLAEADAAMYRNKQDRRSPPGR